MKKILLLMAIALCAGVAAQAVTDGQSYATINGIGVKNLWMLDRVHAGDAFTSLDACHSNARTAVLCNGVVYVARSEAKTVVPTPGDTIQQSVIYRFDAATGKQLPDLDVTLNGEPYLRGGLLSITSIGKDNFGHLWVAPLTSEARATVPVYMVDAESGALTLVTSMDKGESLYRTDYLDVVGDLTLENAECNIMTVAGSTADPGNPTVYRWHNDRGGDIDTWEGGFAGDPYMDFTEYYPAEKVGFSLAPIVKMLLGTDEETLYSGEYFYIDCFDGAPVLYASDGTVVDSFENVPEELWPTRAAANGMNEFSIDDHHFLAYVKADMHGDGNGCQINVCELGEGDMLETMTKYWQLPADSLGKINDAGSRVHSISIEKGIDSEGNEEVTLLTFKSFNGMGVYKIGKGVNTTPQVTGDVNCDGNITAADVTSLYNFILNGDTTHAATSDVNNDGSITAGDVTAVYNLLLGN